MLQTIGEIASALGAVVVGDATLVITRAAEPAMAGPDDLAIAMTPKFAETLHEGQAKAALLWQDADWQAFGLKGAILPQRPRYAMSGLTKMLDPGQGLALASTPQR